jgi:hypothetical protein
LETSVNNKMNDTHDIGQNDKILDLVMKK